MYSSIRIISRIVKQFIFLYNVIVLAPINEDIITIGELGQKDISSRAEKMRTKRIVGSKRNSIHVKFLLDDSCTRLLLRPSISSVVVFPALFLLHRDTNSRQTDLWSLAIARALMNNLFKSSLPLSFLLTTVSSC